MKTKLILLGLILTAITGKAQTNAIVFPQLLSATNSVLMTNAEFRCFVGDKVFFRNDNGYQSFHAPALNTNVLTALGTTAGKLEAKQQALDDANQQFKAEQAAAAHAAAKAEYDRENPTPYVPRTPMTNDALRSEGNFLGESR
jgi:hypothetical protein